MEWSFNRKAVGADHIREDLREFKEVDDHLTDAKGIVKKMVNEDKDALKNLKQGSVIASITQKINQQDFTFDFMPVHDLDSNNIPEYVASPREMPYQQVRIPNPDGKPQSDNSLASLLFNLLGNPEILAKFASEHSSGGNDADSNLYHDTTQTDSNGSAQNLSTFDDYDTAGSSKGKQKPGGSTTMTTDEVMNRKDMPVTDFNNPKQPSSNPSRDTYDSGYANVKEGDMLGLTPSYNAADIYIQITKPSAQWSFHKESLFDQFIGNVGEMLTTCRAHNFSRAATREAVIKVHSALFARHEWMSPILDRFLDRAYGTTAKPKSALSTLQGCVSDYITVAHKNGWTKERTIQSSMNEFSSWVENYPDTAKMITDTAEATYGISAEVLAPFLNKNAANQYAVRLVKSFNHFPVTYAVFRRWCDIEKVPTDTLPALERLAVETHYVAMPEVLVVFADQELYVSDDKTKTQALPKNPDETKNPEEIKLADGTALKRMKP